MSPTYKQKQINFCIVILLATWMWLTLPSIPSVKACLPVGRFDFTVEERTIDAEIVLEGTVVNDKSFEAYFGETNVSQIDGDYGVYGDLGAASATTRSGYSSVIIVHQYLKGSGPAIVEIHGFGVGGSCLSSAMKGERLIFFAKGNPEKVLAANYMGVYSATEEVNPANIAEAIQFSGQQPIIPEYTFAQRLTIFWYKIMWWLICLSPLVFIAVMWFSWKKFKQYKHKKANHNLELSQ